MNGHFSNFPVRYTKKNSSQEMNSKKKKRNEFYGKKMFGKHCLSCFLAIYDTF